MLRRSLLLFAMGYLAACSSPSAEQQPAARADTGVAAADTAPVLDERGCHKLEDEPLPGALCLRTITGRLVDERGEGIEDLPLTACGDACTYGTSGKGGAISITVRRYMRNAALMVKGGTQYATYYVLLVGGGDMDVGTVITPRMSPSTVDLPKSGTGGTVTSGDLTLVIPSTAKIQIDTIEYPLPEERTFAAERVPRAATPPWARDDATLLGVWAIRPFATTIEPGAKVRLRNVLGLAPGAEVEILVHGAALFGDYGPFAQFTKMANGRVSSDGAYIDSDDATPIRQLTWLGVRAR